VLDQRGDRAFPWQAGTGQLPLTAVDADGESARHLDLGARLGPLRLRAGWNDREKMVPTGAFRTVAGPGTTYRDRRGYAELRFDQALGPLAVSARAAYDESRFRGVFQGDAADPAAPEQSAPEDHFTARWATGELRVTLPPLLRQRLTVGAEVQDQFLLDLGGDSRDAQQAAGADRELVLSGYLADEWQVTSRLRVDAGLRADNYQHGFGTAIDPRLAVIAQPYRGGNTKLFVGRAFRAPSSYERFYNDGGFSQDPAGPLRPEVLLSADLEHAHVVEEDLVLTGALFASEVRNLIVLDPSPRAAEVLAFTNRPGKIRSVGASAEVRWEPGGGTSLVAAYSWQRVREIGDDGASTPFPNAPRSVASLRALTALLAPFLRLGNEVIVEVGRRTRDGGWVEDAALWNVTLTGHYRTAHARWRLHYFAGLFNVLDVRGYASGIPVGPEVPALTVPRYGRSARLGLSLAF
jgi:outer membrane receptor for ferrienterochelin and colicins